jgi:hypothetical protein
MKKRIIMIVSVLFLTACATAPPKYGAFVAFDSDKDAEVMAQDAIGQISSVYPPAKTSIQVVHKAEDKIGQALLSGLRTKGYKLYEASQPESDIPIPMFYVLDKIDLSMWRLTIAVGTKEFSRPYLAQNGAPVVAAGCWTYKE